MYTYEARVIRIVDGDTVELEVDCGFRLKFKDRFRLAYINAPELNTSEGQLSSAHLKELLPIGNYVTIDTIRPDKYGRWLVVLYIDGLNKGKTYNQKMVDDGFAVRVDG